MDPEPSPNPGPDTLEQVRANMSQAAVAASFEKLIALPKPKPAIGLVRYGQPPVLRGKWTVVASETQAVDLTAIAFDTARADAETPPREAILFQTTELSGEFTPSAFELERGNITPQPVFAVTPNPSPNPSLSPNPSPSPNPNPNPNPDPDPRPSPSPNPNPT